MYDYVYSPGHSVSGDTDNIDADELTEPSTPSSSIHPASDIHGSIFSGLCENGAVTAVSSRPRSATVPDMLVTTPSYDISTLPAQGSAANLLSPKMSTSLPRQPFTFANDKEPPPLPPRDPAAMVTLKKNKATTQSQPFLENTTKQPDTLKRDGEARRLSSSMDCLLLPEDDSENSQSGASFNKLEAEPYLRPEDVKNMMSGTLPPTTRNSSIFMSMRVSGRSRPPLLPEFQGSVEITDSMKRSKSFERGHKRSQSNPFILDLLASMTEPPELPPRNPELPPAVQARRSPQHLRSSRSPPPLPAPVPEETFESSLEFGSSLPGGRVSVVSRISRARSPQAIVRELKEHTFNDVEDDNQSTISGPFEEIDANQEHSDMSTSQGIVRDVSTHTLRSQTQQQVSGSGDYDENDQYARIEDVTRDQQYIAMAPAPAIVKGTTLPAQRISYLSGDDLDEEEGGGKRAKSMSQATAPPTPKKDASVLVRTVRRFRKQRTEPIVRESTDSPSPPPPGSNGSAHSFSSSVSTSLLASPNRHTLPRPLPPSPTKGAKPSFNPVSRKQSSGTGSNIYETIDEEMFHRVTGRSRRQGSTKNDGGKTGLPLPVPPEMMTRYLLVVQKFFNIPEVQAKWVETVKELMPDEDADDIPPPLYNTANESNEKENQRRHIKSEGSNHDDDEIPILVPQADSTPITLPALAQRSPLTVSPKSPFQSPRHMAMIKSGAAGSPLANSPLMQRQAELIEMMNQQLHHQNSSDSETDSDEEAGQDEDERGTSDSESSDSDVEHTEREEDKRRKTSLSQHHTDLDEALVLHNSLSTDSDHIEMDHVIKSPQSASAEDLEERGVGVAEDHCVKPSEFLHKIKQRSAGSDLQVGGGSRTLSDSGISNQNYEENNQSETDC